MISTRQIIEPKKFINIICDHSQSRSREPILISGAPGTGKSVIAAALKQHPDLGVKHVPSHYWFKMSPFERMVAWKRAHRARDFEYLETIREYQAIIDWPKFQSDLGVLMDTGELHLDRAYHPKDDSWKPVHIQMPRTLPCVLLVTGTCLTHKPIVDMAGLSLFLEDSFAQIGRMAAPKGFTSQYDEWQAEETTRFLAAHYYNRYAKYSYWLEMKAVTALSRARCAEPPIQVNRGRGRHDYAMQANI